MGMNDETTSMPTALKIVLGFFALSLCFDGYALATGVGSTVQSVRIVIAVCIIIGLLRGSDSVRGIVRGLSILGTIGGVIGVLRIAPYVADAPFELVATGLGAGVLAIVGSLFTFFVLGSLGVETWMARRAFARMR